MKKVLIITYYWPPSGGAGVHRWLKFVKYIRNYGWEPVIYTPLNPEVPATDETLKKQVPDNLTIIKTKVWEPYSIYKLFIGAKKNQKVNAGFLSETKKPRLTEKIAVWFRGNFFIPDARMFWINPSFRFLKKFLKDNPVDAVISTGPPHSMHRIALKLHRKTKIPWLADFRDPWTGIDFYDKLMLTPMADKYHHKLEKEVLTEAEKVVTVSQNWAKDMEKLCNRKIDVVTNGFDESDFDNQSYAYPENFKLSHIGALNKDRNPHILWESLSELVNEISGFSDKLRIELVGKTDITVMESIENAGLTNFTTKTEYLSHNEAVNKEFSSAILLLLINNTPNSLGIIPGKLFEYLATGRTILCIGPAEGDSAQIILKSNAGRVVPFNDKNKLKQILKDLYNDYISGQLTSNREGINIYTRRNLAGQIADLLNEIQQIN